ncbi:MAG: hypothetical protein AAGI68_14690 [Planctomycetota bacterium]
MRGFTLGLILVCVTLMAGGAWAGDGVGLAGVTPEFAPKTRGGAGQEFVAFSQWAGPVGRSGGVGGVGVLGFTASVGEVQTTPAGYGSAVDAARRVVSPGYASLGLTDNRVLLELAGRGRAAVYRMTFPESEQCHALIDVSYPRDRFEGGEIRLHDAKTIEGFGEYRVGGEVVRVYFTFRFSKPFRQRSAWDGTGVLDRGVGRAESPQALGAYVFFWNREGETILVKRGVSTVSLEDARASLYRDFPGWDFNGLVREARAAE